MKTILFARKIGVLMCALVLLHTLWSCFNKENVIVKGDLKSATTFLEGKKVYLGNAETRGFADSAMVQDGQFAFTIKAGKDFVPFRAAIVFETGNPEWPHQLVDYVNPYFKKTQESNFYAEPGVMELSLDTIRMFTPQNKVVTFEIKEMNRQTEVLFHHYTLKATGNASLVEKHSYSRELLRILNAGKLAISTDESKRLLALFDPELHADPVYQNLHAYVNYENKTGSDFPAQLKQELLDSSRHNLIVFWASWCGPCRMEIPQLKKLHESKGAELNVVSISVDKSREAWAKAVKQEQMPWKQFLLPAGEDYAALDKKYNLQTIPLWVLLDQKGKVVDQQVGYESGNNAVDLKVAALLK